MNTKLCPSYPGYSASEDGRVFTHRRRTRLEGCSRGGTKVVIDPSYSRELTASRGAKGYLYVAISLGGRQTRRAVHVMVLDAFAGPRPAEQEGRHLDGNPGHNARSNLSWGTAVENAADRQAHGHYARGARHVNARLTEAAVLEILRARAAGFSIAELARVHGRSEPCVADVVHRRTWRHVEFRRLP